MSEQDDIERKWRLIPGLYGYEVSSDGRVRSLIRHGKLLSISLNRDGYPHISIGNKCHRKTCKIHSLVAMAFIGPRLDGYVVNHIDGNKANNSVENLEYVTALENARHASRAGLYPTGDKNGSRTRPERRARGERNGLSKLTAENVREIRRLILDGSITKVSIAKKFGVTPANIWWLSKPTSWAHIPREIVNA